MSNIRKLFTNKGSTASYALLTAVFTVVPEDCFLIWRLCDKWKNSTNALINRLIACVAIFIIANIIYTIWRKNRKEVQVTGDNFAIQIEYGDLLKIPTGKVVINFDECFTTKVGTGPADIKPTSVCGQYLAAHPITSMQELIDNAGIKPAKGKSEYNSQTRYTPGTIIPREQFFLMAFAKLDKNGRGYLGYKDYLDCLNTLWEQIDLYHGTNDVYIPILGSNITYFERQLTQQELLDIMVSSYILNPKRMKKPCKLHIICRKRDGFLLDDVKGID